MEEATRLFGPFAEYDPYLVEWHRRTKADRPSGTALELSRRIIAAHPRKQRTAQLLAHGAPAPEELDVAVIRAGSAPGMHLVGFDAPGESLELRLTARDRSAYAAGAVAVGRVAAGRASHARHSHLRRSDRRHDRRNRNRNRNRRSRHRAARRRQLNRGAIPCPPIARSGEPSRLS